MFVWIIPPIKGRTSFLGGSIFYFYIMSVLFASFYLYGCIWRWRTRHHHIGLWVGRAGPSRPILQVKQKKKEINIFPFAFLEVFACYRAITAKWKISSRFLLKKSQQVYFFLLLFEVFYGLKMKEFPGTVHGIPSNLYHSPHLPKYNKEKLYIFLFYFLRRKRIALACSSKEKTRTPFSLLRWGRLRGPKYRLVHWGHTGKSNRGK